MPRFSLSIHFLVIVSRPRSGGNPEKSPGSLSDRSPAPSPGALSGLMESQGLSVNIPETWSFCSLHDSVKALVAIINKQKNSEEKMKKTQQSPQGSGKSYDIRSTRTGPDCIRFNLERTGEHQLFRDEGEYDPLPCLPRGPGCKKRLNTKIERLDPRLTVLEERERAK